MCASAVRCLAHGPRWRNDAVPMTAIAPIIAFVPVAALLTITPGTDTMLVLRTAGLAGAGPAARAALGIALGCLAWGLAVATGLGALLVASPVIFGWVRLLGAVYLGWIGIGLIVRAGRGVPAGMAGAAGTAFRRGLLTNLLNPKIGVFYLTLLPQFLPPGAGAGAGLMLAGIHIVLTLIWFALLIGAAARIAPALADRRLARAIDRACGAVFIGFGVRIALA